MTYFNKNIFCILVNTISAALLIPACSSLKEQLPEDLSSHSIISTKMLPPTVQINRNPYEISNMQFACDSLCIARHIPRRILSPTDYYVKVSNLTTDEYEELSSLGIEFFPFPLGGETEEEVIDTTILYCVVRHTDMIPSAISYEIIDTCFIPSNYDILNTLSIDDEPDSNDIYQFFDDVENLSCAINDPVSTMSRSSSSNLPPSGRVEVQDAGRSTYSPLKGIKVSAHYWSKTASAYTDATGTYTMDQSFKGNPRYHITFSNRDRYAIHTVLSPKYPLCHNYWWHNKNGYDIKITTSDNRLWDEAITYNAIWDYYLDCTNKGKTLPPAYLRVWMGTLIANGSVTLMLHHIINTCPRDEQDNYIDYIRNGIGELVNLACGIMPDIYLCNGCSVSTVWHELNHASHFSQVGWPLWIKMYFHISRSLQRDVNKCYGLGLDNDEEQQICELLESWAYAVERYSTERYYGLIYNPLPNWRSELWFRYSAIAIYNILYKGILSESQILSCMDTSVKSINDLYSALITRYPSKAAIITKYFVENNALPNYTKWTIVNQTSSTLHVHLGYGTRSEDTTLAIGASCHIFSAGVADASCNYLLSSTPSLLPTSIRIRNASGTDIFWRENGSVIKPLSSRPFFSNAEWSSTAPIHYDIGDRTEYNNTFVFTDSVL